MRRCTMRWVSYLRSFSSRRSVRSTSRRTARAGSSRICTYRGRAVNLYDALGGTASCRKLSTAFYARVARDPILRPLFPGKTFKCAIEEFTAFLVQFLGGPPEDTQRRWWLRLRESHSRFKIGPRERDAAMKNMIAASNDEHSEG